MISGPNLGVWEGCPFQQLQVAILAMSMVLAMVIGVQAPLTTRGCHLRLLQLQMVLIMGEIWGRNIVHCQAFKHTGELTSLLKSRIFGKDWIISYPTRKMLSSESTFWIYDFWKIYLKFFSFKYNASKKFEHWMFLPRFTHSCFLNVVFELIK